jgi:hypothetical protein
MAFNVDHRLVIEHIAAEVCVKVNPKMQAH